MFHGFHLCHSVILCLQMSVCLQVWPFQSPCSGRTCTALPHQHLQLIKLNCLPRLCQIAQSHSAMFMLSGFACSLCRFIISVVFFHVFFYSSSPVCQRAPLISSLKIALKPADPVWFCLWTAPLRHISTRRVCDAQCYSFVPTSAAHQLHPGSVSEAYKCSPLWWICEITNPQENCKILREVADVGDNSHGYEGCM